ncbi:hypothetical protein D3C73_837900 [compost metagenome]
MFLAVFDVVQAEGLRQFQRGVDLQVVALEQVLQIAGSGQRIMLRRIEQTAVGKHQFQPFQLQGAGGEGFFVHFEQLHAPVKRRIAQGRLRQLMLVELILILEMLWQKEHAFGPHHPALLTH